MNVYLVGVGSQVFKIRNLLNLSQQTLSEKMGVSRPIIINIEKDPTNMTLAAIMGLYVVSFGEIVMKRKKLEELNYDLWDKKENREDLIDNIIDLGVDKKVIAVVLGSSAIASNFFAPVLLPIALVGGAVSLFSRTINGKDSELKKDHIKKLVFNSLDVMESEICACFNIATPSLELFLDNIKKGES